MKRPEPRRCLFVASGQTNHRGVAICGECGGLRTDRRHDLPVTPEQAAVIDARRLGEDVSDMSSSDHMGH